MADGFPGFILDGDKVRKGLSADLEFSEAGSMVLGALISPFRGNRDHVRSILEPGQFIEIYRDCSLDECEKRDVKGMYAKARKGEIKDFTGILAL